MEKTKFTAICLLGFLIIHGCKTDKDIVVIQTPIAAQTESTAAQTADTVTTAITATTTTITVTIDERLKWSFKDKNQQSLEQNIQNLFITIEEKIANKDFSGWYEAISENYKNFLNDQVNMENISKKSPYLHNKGIILQTPQDFFSYVVVPAREGNKLEYRGYKKIDDNNIRVLNGIPGYKDNYSYSFIYQNGSWHLDR